jgi:hypothetical protein
MAGILRLLQGCIYDSQHSSASSAWFGSGLGSERRSLLNQVSLVAVGIVEDIRERKQEK